MNVVRLAANHLCRASKLRLLIPQAKGRRSLDPECYEYLHMLNGTMPLTIIYTGGSGEGRGGPRLLPQQKRMTLAVLD